MKRTSILLVVVVFLLGLSLFLYPFIYKEKENIRIVETIETFENQEQEQIDEEYISWQEYNKSLFQNQNFNVEDLFAFENSDIKTDEVIATVEIPAINVKLPVYNGGSEENMAKGAIYLPHTSLPTGDNNTNTVIGAHLRHKGVDMFRYLSCLVEDDEIIIKTKWDTLTYEVSETKVIEPSELTYITIKENKKQLTLFTCYPYPKSTHRFIVICQLRKK